MEERRSRLEVFVSDLPKLGQHLLHCPDEPQLLVSLPAKLRDVTEYPRGVDGIKAFEETEV